MTTKRVRKPLYNLDLTDTEEPYRHEKLDTSPESLGVNTLHKIHLNNNKMARMSAMEQLDAITEEHGSLTASDYSIPWLSETIVEMQQSASAANELPIVNNDSFSIKGKTISTSTRRPEFTASQSDTRFDASREADEPFVFAKEQASDSQNDDSSSEANKMLDTEMLTDEHDNLIQPRVDRAANTRLSTAEALETDPQCEAAAAGNSHEHASLMSILIDVDAFNGLTTAEMIELSKRAAAQGSDCGDGDGSISDQSDEKDDSHEDASYQEDVANDCPAQSTPCTILQLEELLEYRFDDSSDSRKPTESFRVESQPIVNGNSFSTYNVCLRSPVAALPWRRALRAKLRNNDLSNKAVSHEATHGSYTNRYRANPVLRGLVHQQTPPDSRRERALFSLWPVFYFDHKAKVKPVAPVVTRRLDRPTQEGPRSIDSGYESCGSKDSPNSFLASGVKQDREYGEQHSDCPLRTPSQEEVISKQLLSDSVIILSR